MARSRPPAGWTWVYDPAGAFRRSKKPVPADFQHEVERRAQALIDPTLKPRYIQPPPKKTELNYLRLQYAGDERFNLAYFRHTGQWWEVDQLLSLEECLSEIEAGGLFTP